MKTNKKMIFSGLALATLLSAGAISTASAYRGDSSQKGPNYSEERHAIMEKAFETNDYSLWKDQMAGRGVTNVINENNFSKFAEAHRLTEEGKNDEANKIREELQLRTNNGQSLGLGRGMHDGNGTGRGAGMHR